MRLDKLTIVGQEAMPAACSITEGQGNLNEGDTAVTGIDGGG
ncbi:hypothetical protein ACFL0G_01010 [Candidatus Zixiibacteriota bacterium]